LARARLFLAALALGAILLAAACGGGDDSQQFKDSPDPAAPIPAGQVGTINAVIAGTDWFVGENNFVVGITNAQDQPQGGATVRITFYDNIATAQQRARFTLDAVQSAPGVGAPVEHVHADGAKHVHGGEDEDRVGYFVRVQFDHAGNWGASVEATLRDGTRGVSNVGFQVTDRPAIPAPGMKAIASDNLTRFDVADISEIDSGNPPNDMHDVKIKDSLDAGRPLVIVFATPAYCPSRFCGPVTEEVEALQEKYGDRVDFVHIEIWRNFDRRELNATAREWLVRADGSLSEPFVYVIDREGTIYDRFEGPVAANVMEAAVKAVAEGRVYGKG
jgi:hypothetical protein